MTLQTVLATLIFVATPITAQAYIDPGTGGLAVQTLLAAIATALVTVKLWWSRLLNLFRKDKKTKKEPSQEQDGPHAR